MKKKILSLLVLLVAAVSGVWADELATSYTSDAELSAVTVSASMEVNIAAGVTVTINNGLTISSGTLTVKGPGTLVVNGAGGSQGEEGAYTGGDGGDGGTGGNGGTAIVGNVIINGANVTATGGKGGTGGNGSYGGQGGNGDNGCNGGTGGTGGTGGSAFSGAVIIYAGSVTANGGQGGQGGKGGDGGDGGEAESGKGGDGGSGGFGGVGGQGGFAFAGTLTVFGGNVTANGGEGGNGNRGGYGAYGGEGDPSGNDGTNRHGNFAAGGSAGTAYASNVTFEATTYTMTDGTNNITDATGKNNVIIQSPDVLPEPPIDYLFTVAPCEYGSGTVKFFIEGKEVEGAYETDEGKTVTVTVTPDAGWVVDDTKVKAESYSTWEAAGAPSRRAPGNIQILGDVTLTKSTTAENTWTFQMPAASVLVSAGYIKSSTLYFDPADKTNLVTVTVDGTDRNLNGSKTVKIKRVDNVLEGTAVSLKANDGYKFRKVQVTKTDNGLKLTNPTVGQVIGSDGKNYAYASLPTGVTAVAKICYVSGNSGLALALADESSMMDWATAIETCAAHTPAFKGAEWKLASQDEWNNMKSGAGNYANLRNGFSSVGGTDMRSLQEETYWSSTEQVNSQNAWYMLNSGNWYRHDKSVTKYVRACLAF